MSNGTLPEENLFDILSRLPVKSLCRFKCVSTPWRSLITGPRFVKTHLNRNNRCEKIIIDGDSLYSVDCTEASNNHAVTATKLDLPSNIHCTNIVGSCNGLILVADSEQPKFLLNPSTREFKELPKFYRLSGPPVPKFRMYGLGYDSPTDDYKAVVVWDTHISFYTSRIGSWVFRYVSDFPYNPILPGTESFSVGALVNGSLHWLANKKCSVDSPYVICAFDVTNQKLRDILVPCPLENCKKSSDLGVLGGCLTMVVCHNHSKTDVWVMKEYGVTESWTKFLTIDLWSFCRTPRMISMVNGVVLLDVDDNTLVGYISEEEESWDIRVNGIPSKFRAKMTYVESLISPPLPTL